jgi:Zn-dependent protease with chaperone function
MALSPYALHAEYFNGHTSRPHTVRLRVTGDRLHVAGPGVALEVPLRDVQWPESTGGSGPEAGSRVAHLKGGGSLHCADGAGWDAWARASGLSEPLVVKLQRSWAWTLSACGVLVAIMAAGYLWGVPLAVQGVLAFTPQALDRSVGELALQQMVEPMLAPSTLPPAQQQRLHAAFAQAVQQAYPADERPAYELRFHAARDKRLGPNAFALPGGFVVMTDELVKLVEGDEAVIVGVLAHELGHVRHRHGMHALARGALLTVATSAALGDVSSLMAALPALLGQLGYSRDFERQADQEAVRVLRAAGHSPAVMVSFFEKIGNVRRGEPATAGSPPASSPQAARPDPAAHDAQPERDPPLAFSTHPADAERIRFFQAAARGQ